MLNQTTNKIQSLGFGYKKIDAIKHQLIINGALTTHIKEKITD